MEKLFKLKKQILKVCLALIFLIAFFVGNVFGAEFDVETSKYYENWKNLSDKEKKEVLMPSSFAVDMPESKLKTESTKIPSIVGYMTGEIKNLKSVGNILPSKFTLKDEMALRVENQGITNECWAFSVLKAMETNIALRYEEVELEDFSERHMDYSSIKTFKDGINKNALNREVGDGGLPIIGLAYLTSGKGAVKEEDLKFENNIDKIYLKDLDKNVEEIVTDYDVLPGINKSYSKDSNGNTIAVTYSDSNGNTYSKLEVEQIREYIKSYIMENGAVVSFTAGSKADFYNTNSVFESTAYNCNDTGITRDHAITIVGWDDNYSKDNFKNGKKPSEDGAYIILNSYGDKAFDKGYLYISYEDYFVESELYGIKETSSVDYEKIYQYDEFGGIYKLGAKNSKEGYIANIFEKEKNKTEILNSVGVTLGDYADVEIYVNANGDSLDLNNLELIGESYETLTPGYHRIDVTPKELSSDKFAIVIKQKAIENRTFSFEIEVAVEDTAYENVVSEGKSFISIEEGTWVNLKELNVPNIDTSKADVCIKGFTTEKQDDPETPIEEPVEDPVEDPVAEEIKISSNNYKIIDNYIMNIKFKTSVEEFISNIETNSEEIKILSSDGKEIIQDELIKTGSKIKLSDDKEYILIVRGDANLDGDLTLTDLSKAVLHYNGNKGFELSGVAEKAIDMNLDGQVTLVDISQIVELYNQI